MNICKRYLVTGIISTILLLSCGSDPIQKGDQAFNEGNFGLALKNYKTAFEQGDQTPELRGKLARAALKLGMDLYQKRRVIRALEARIREAETYLPDPPLPEEMQKAFSEAYLMLAGAYEYERPENYLEKRRFFDAALECYSKAIALDSANQDAQNALQEFKEKHFEEHFQKGLKFFEEAKKDKSNYFSAEYFFDKAYRMAPEHSEAAEYLKRTREAALPLLNLNQAFPFAISDKLEKPEWVAFYIFLQNNTLNPDTVSADNFYLVTAEGKEIQGQASDLFSKPFQTQPLESAAEAKGVVAFPLASGEQPLKLIYRDDNKIQGFKFLP